MKTGIFRIWLWAVLLAVSLVASSHAQETADPTLGPVTGYPLPRFVSLKTPMVNVRRGPGKTYRIDWIMVQAGTPLQVTAEFGNWLRVRDEEGAGGWIYDRLLTGTRTVVIQGQRIAVHKEPIETSKTIALAEKGVIASLGSCERLWCEITADGHTGWVIKTDIWGVGAAELRD